MKRSDAVITVFFSLLSVVFLSLTFTVAEAVRCSGARAHCADLMVLGNWSVFSEYENRLLEDYSILAVDGSYGTGTFSVSKVNARLKKWLDANADADAGLKDRFGLLSDPWRVTAKSSDIPEYALLTDRNGEYFYQQAVDYMRSTAVTGALSDLLDLKNQADTARQDEESYKNSRASDDSLKNMKNTVASREKEVRSGSTDDILIYDSSVPQTESAAERQLKKSKKIKNPVWKILSLKRKNVLDLVCGNTKRSSRKLPGWQLPSKRSKHTGSLKLKAEYRSAMDDLLFREYLMDHYPNYRDSQDSSRLNYQVEYIIGGTASDEKNLKKTVKSLLLLRETYNYMFLSTDAASVGQTQSLSLAILGWTGSPELIEAFRQGMMVCWAWGESLYDVRILMHGGKVPVIKTAADWHVPLSGLASLDKELKKADRTAGSGIGYGDYLRILLNFQTISTQKKRALDLLEINIRQADGMSAFRVDNCIVALRDSSSWEIEPVFSRLPQALIGTSAPRLEYTVQSGFSY